jgi:hypothetical protein
MIQQTEEQHNWFPKSNFVLASFLRTVDSRKILRRRIFILPWVQEIQVTQWLSTVEGRLTSVYSTSRLIWGVCLNWGVNSTVYKILKNKIFCINRHCHLVFYILKRHGRKLDTSIRARRHAMWTKIDYAWTIVWKSARRHNVPFYTEKKQSNRNQKYQPAFMLD